MPCGSVVVRTPSDAAWDSNGATVYFRRAVINFCDSEGHLKPRDGKMPIAGAACGAPWFCPTSFCPVSLSPSSLLLTNGTKRRTLGVTGAVTFMAGRTSTEARSERARKDMGA